MVYEPLELHFHPDGTAQVSAAANTYGDGDIYIAVRIGRAMVFLSRAQAARLQEELAQATRGPLQTEAA